MNSDDAHKIKNLLAGIKAFADLLKRKVGDEESLLYLSKIEKKVDDITSFIEDLQKKT